MQKYRWKYLKNPSKSSTLIEQLLVNRGLKTKKEQDDFLHPSLDSLFNDIPFPEMAKAVDRIRQAITNREKMAVFTDYDVDGICAGSIIWETIHGLGGDIKPYMPNRMTEGYGLSINAVDILNAEGVKLIITVDNGITCVKQIDHATNLGIDVILTDHHQKPPILPTPYATVWSDQICGAGVAFVISKHLRDDVINRQHLDLAALATVADVMPLLRFNRAIVKEGLIELNRTKRVGLQAMFHEANVQEGAVDAWTIGHVIAPRLNAAGRLDDAMDSIRLLCTNNPLKAKSLAMLLAKTNTDRQKLTEKMVEDAMLLYDHEMAVGVLAHETWHEGVVGLVAGRMVERHYKPMIAIAMGSEFSKGSARSIPGFNIIDALRSCSDLFENLGGHPMAAGFTVRTEKIEHLRTKLNAIANKHFQETPTERTLAIDAVLPLTELTLANYQIMSSMEPFGNANPEPIFVTHDLEVLDIRKVGATGKHVKLALKSEDNVVIEAIGFNMAETLHTLRPNDIVDAAYTISLNTWNNKSKIELKLKDIKKA